MAFSNHNKKFSENGHLNNNLIFSLKKDKTEFKSLSSPIENKHIVIQTTSNPIVNVKDSDIQTNLKEDTLAKKVEEPVVEEQVVEEPIVEEPIEESKEIVVEETPKKKRGRKKKV